MKFKKFQSLTKATNRVDVIHIEKENLQFLSNGYTVYPIHNLPTLNDEMILALFDIDDKKRDSFSISHKNDTHLNYKDTIPDEQILVSAGFTLKFDTFESVVRPVFTEYGLYYYDPRWLAPFEGEDYTLFLRFDRTTRDDPRPYIAVKAGMLLLGFVNLGNLNNKMNKFILDSREDLETLCSMLEFEE